MDQNEDQTMRERLEGFLSNDTEELPQVFAEMQEYISGRWVQTARWVKFMEIADIDGGRWSAPYVASFSGKTVTFLQKLLRNGICNFSADFNNINVLVKSIARQAIENGFVNASDKTEFVETLLSKHIHFSETIRGPAEAFYKSAQVASGHIGLKHFAIDFKTKDNRINKKFAKKLDKNAEGASVLVGAVEFLSRPMMIFMRNNIKTAYLEELTEVSVPLRYVCVILGPLQRLSMMREVGHLWGAALSDEIFELVATNADSKADLLAGITNFAEHSTMLAPGQWNPVERLAPPKHRPGKDERKAVANYDALLADTDDSSLLNEQVKSVYQVHLPPGLLYTGRLFGGMVGDIKRKAPHFLSEFSDALSIQSLSTILYLSIIILAQMVSFGGLMGEATGNNIATFESIISSCINGVIYHALAAQPLNVISTTGPVLIFERVLYQFCQSWGFAFLEFRFWVGMWMSVLMIILVMFDLSFLVGFLTRFTEDNFATLIACIFIYESINSVMKTYNQHPLQLNPSANVTSNATLECFCDWDKMALQKYNTAANTTGIDSLNWKPISMAKSNMTGFIIPQCATLNETLCKDWKHCLPVGDGCNYVEPVPDVFLFTIILFFCTFFFATSLNEFRHAIYFPTKIRQLISDFAVTITVVGMVALDYFCGLPTAKLLVPDEFHPTIPDRGWVANPFGENPVWSIFLAFPLGLLACILMFMDQQITTVIVNRKEHKLKKGFGYHLDLFVLTLTIIISSVFGLTWLVAATVVSIGHLNSLKRESESAAPGEPPKFLGLIEQRVTGIGFSIAIGLSLVLKDVLKVAHFSL